MVGSEQLKVRVPDHVAGAALIMVVRPWLPAQAWLIHPSPSASSRTGHSASPRPADPVTILQKYDEADDDGRIPNFI
ncbi:unnamed protein product [Arctogadus glacialis]